MLPLVMEFPKGSTLKSDWAWELLLYDNPTVHQKAEITIKRLRKFIPDKNENGFWSIM